MKKNKKQFNYYIDLWLENKKYTVKESTYCYYYALAENHIRPFFYELTCNQIDEMIISKYINKISLKNEDKNIKISKKTLKDILVVLRQIVKLANIKIEIALPRVTKKEVKIFSLEEQLKFEEKTNVCNDSVKFCMYLCLYTGLRIGEVCALKWKDVDLEKGLIFVSKTMIRVKNLSDNKKAKTKVILSDAKTDNSVRIIPLPKKIVHTLKGYKSLDDAFLITGTNKFMEPRLYHNKFKKVLNEIKINDYKFHVLRHTFASNCIRKGFDPKTLSEILGHSDIRLTLSLYVHSDIELKRCMMEKLV